MQEQMRLEARTLGALLLVPLLVLFAGFVAASSYVGYALVGAGSALFFVAWLLIFVRWRSRAFRRIFAGLMVALGMFLVTAFAIDSVGRFLV